MLENVSPRLGERGGPHHGSPDKAPAARLATHRGGGQAQGAVHHRHPDRHRRDAGGAHRLAAGDRRSCIAATATSRKSSSRISAPRTTPAWRARRSRTRTRCCGPWRWRGSCSGRRMNIQAPPNLSPGLIADLIAAGINDWGGVSPVTPDHVNPEAPWPAIEQLRAGTAAAGKCLTERLAIYPDYVREPARWLDPALHTAVLRASDADGYARGEGWAPGLRDAKPSVRFFAAAPAIASSAIDRDHPTRQRRTTARRGRDRHAVRGARRANSTPSAPSADALRKSVSGDTIGYVVNRNINYTNICNYGCRFCAFSKGKLGDTLRGPAYDLDSDEIARRVREAWDRGATEVCMQGGIHPRYTGATYLGILEAAKRAVQRHPCPRVLAAGGASRRDQPRPDRRRLSRPAARRRARQPAGHRGRNPRRRGARRALPGQALDRAMARHRRGGASPRASHHRDHHVRPHRPAGALGAASAAHPRSAGAHRRLHRVRAAAVRAHGSAALSARAARGRARPCARRC